MKLTIRKGEVWTSQRWKWLLVQGLPTWKRSRTWRVRFEKPIHLIEADQVVRDGKLVVENFRETWPTIELLGLHDITWRYERIRHGGWQQLLLMRREESRCLNAHFGEDGVELKTHIYTQGKGSATIYHMLINRSLGTFEYGEWVRIKIWVGNYSYFLAGSMPRNKVLDGDEVVNYPNLPFRSWFRKPSGAHANNGPDSPVAPCDIQFEIEILKDIYK